MLVPLYPTGVSWHRDSRRWIGGQDGEGDLVHDFLINFSPLLIWIFLQWVVFPKLGVPT